MTAAELRLEGASNFRDIGGHVTSDGRRIKTGIVFRSGELSRLTDNDLDVLRRLRVAFVADLRSVGESGLHISRWPQDMATEQYCADISPDLRVNGRSMVEMLKENATPEGVMKIVGYSFNILPAVCGPSLKMIVDRLADGIEPVVFHCTNGRDRTGVIAAMLLYMLGAPREDIVTDFLTTNERIDIKTVVDNSMETFRRGLGIDIERETVELISLVHAEYIDILFDGIAEKYGSPEGYLQGIGIDQSKQQALRARLLQQA